MGSDEPIPTYSKLANGFSLRGEINSLFDFPFDDFAGLWFRGQSCLEWDLRPSLLRREREFGLEYVEEWESVLNREFRRQAARFLPMGPSDSAGGLYMQAQHAGFPTRLLDWSTNPLAAIFFAVEEEGPPNCKGGALFALDIAHMEGIGDEEDERFENACDALFQRQSPEDKQRLAAGFGPSPMPIEPNIREGRMAQQASRFTFHMGRDNWPSMAVRVWFIPRGAKLRLLYQLDSLNVNRATLFPDFENLARHYAKGLDPSLRSYVFGRALDELFDEPTAETGGPPEAARPGN